MLLLIHRLPDLVILGLAVLSTAGLAFASPFLGRHVLRLKPDQRRDEATFDAFKAVMAMAGVVLAFSLVQADGNLRAAQGIVDREASAILLADRAMLRFGNPAALASRPLLADFVQSQLRDEWPSLADKGRNADTENRYTSLSRAVRAIEPQTRREEVLYTELVKAVDDMSDDRDSLIVGANTELPGFFWTVALSFVWLGLAMGLLSEASINRATALAATAAGIGLMMAFVMIVDQPYQGETSVNVKSLQKALVLNAHRV